MLRVLTTVYWNGAGLVVQKLRTSRTVNINAKAGLLIYPLRGKLRISRTRELVHSNKSLVFCAGPLSALEDNIVWRYRCKKFILPEEQ